MNAISSDYANPFSISSTFVPLALGEEDIATYAIIASTLGCTPEQCGEGFMHATPVAREAAVLLWRGAVAMTPPGDAGRALRLQDTLGTLRALLGLDTQAMPLAALADAGLRYHA